MGNIVRITDGTDEKAHYYYDSSNQLTREDDSNRGKTTAYSYDAGGNVTSKTVYAYTTDQSLSGKTVLSTVNGTTREYYYENGKIAYEKTSSTNEISYIYDSNGALVAMSVYKTGINGLYSYNIIILFAIAYYNYYIFLFHRIMVERSNIYVCEKSYSNCSFGGVMYHAFCRLPDGIGGRNRNSNNKL